MESFVPLEVWAILVAAPCVIAWFLGDMYGAARMQRILEAGETNETLNLTPKSQKRSYDAERNASKSKRPDPPALARGEPTETVQTIEARRKRECFADLPCLANLHEQARRIREADKVWDDPELRLNLLTADSVSERVLQHYRGSISELGRSNALSERADLSLAENVRRIGENAVR